jgi:hypothetical protein
VNVIVFGATGMIGQGVLRECKGSYVFRPAVVLPMHGERSRTTAYRVLYAIAKPLLPLLKRVMPGQIVTTEQFGRAMLLVARQGAPKRVLESADINALAPA